MSQIWVVDSNCFIHLGSMAPATFQKDLFEVLRTQQTSLYVTSGVHSEVRNVRFQRWSGQPNLLEELKPILTTVAIDEGQIRGLGQLIGEKASPQDVDLSLMVLANQLHREGNEVVLVTDDFKMTTTGEKANLGFSTCPPSTFVQRLASLSPRQSRSRLRSLSRRVRAAEMRYAISRVHQYDIQAKLTWMVDSLIDDRPRSQKSKPSNATSLDLKSSLQRHLAGEKLKTKVLKQLGSLPEVCQPILQLDEHLSSLASNIHIQSISESYDATLSIHSDVVESIGLRLAPLDEASAELVHSAISGSLYRSETALGLMAKMSGKREVARYHLSNAIQCATLIDDLYAEMHAVYQLGLLATASGNWSRGARLFETAVRQAQSISAPRLPYLVCAGICRHLLGETNTASQHIELSQAIIQTDTHSASLVLLNVGEALLAVDQPGLAMEVLDEAMECSLHLADTSQLDVLAELMLMANAAMTEQDMVHHDGMRELLDGLHELSEHDAGEFEKKIRAIESLAILHAQPLEETWNDWQPSSKLIPEDHTLRVVRTVIDSNEDTLVIVHHSELGSIGLWLPDGEWNISSGHLLSIGVTRVKVAQPPDDLQNQHSIRGIVAVEDSQQLLFQAPTEELLMDHESTSDVTSNK